MPHTAITYCADLHRQHNFQLRLSRPRCSKLGDYRYRQYGTSAVHTISINEDLNPYAFLITYLHEVAHLVAFQTHGLQIKPHGSEWQRSFQELLQPVLLASVFPPSLLPCVRHYAEHPKATSGADPRLSQALRTYDTTTVGVPLADVSPNTSFRFRKNIYIKLDTRRTRALCQRIGTKQCYLIQEIALVEPLATRQ